MGSSHGYKLPDGSIDNRRLLADARQHALSTKGPTRMFIFMLCKALEQIVDRLGRTT